MQAVWVFCVRVCSGTPFVVPGLGSVCLLIGPPEDLFVYVDKMDDCD